MNEYKGIMVFAQNERGKIHKVSYELLGKAQNLKEKTGEEISCILLGPEGLGAKELIYRGADKVYYIQDDNIFNEPEEMVYKENIIKLIKEKKPAICLFGATNFGRSIAPRVAAALKCGLTADCTGLDVDEDGSLIQIRPAFSENILAHIKSEQRPQMSTVRYKEFAEAKKDETRSGEIKILKAKKDSDKMIKILKQLEQSEIDITEAEIVVAVGMGLKTKEDLKMVNELADLLDGQVGASRDFVEEGYIDKSHQVGYSGNRVKPKLYVALGISGAPQHIAGMKESDMIIAVNNDPSAPIFNIADYGIVADLYDVVPVMIEKIKNQKGLKNLKNIS